MTALSKTKNYFTVEFDREDDGRWIAEMPKLPGVMAYGPTKEEARKKVYAIALRTLADNIEQGGMRRRITQLFNLSRYGVGRR